MESGVKERTVEEPAGAVHRESRHPAVAGQIPGPPRTLVLHADDLGFSPAINRGIIDGFQRGLLTSTSVLANAPAVTDAIALWNELELRRRHRLLASDGPRRHLRDPWLPFDLGVHLNLTQGRPLTAGYPLELLDSHGRFPGVGGLFARSLVAVRSAIRSAVEQELQAQIELLLDHRAPLGHLNGHQYVECLPLVSEIVPRLARRYSLRTVRVAWEPGLTRGLLVQGAPREWGLAQIKRLFAFRWKLQATRHGLQFPHCYFGTAHAGRITGDVLRRFLRAARGNFVEIGMHPGQAPLTLRMPGRGESDEGGWLSADDDWQDPLAAERPFELELLTSLDMAEWIATSGWTLGRLSQLGLTSAARQRQAA
jgi:predicted glycoside hydrolase/deacetylase ChbG (UPF0249 family)